jgi:RimJ/RimL family protein N-acetyltransferase
MTDVITLDQKPATETVPDKTPGTGSRDQTFLVGENVYLRTFAPGDEKTATRWRQSVFPKSPELVEKWIKEDLPKDGKNNRSHLAIVRKADDEIVGSMQILHETVGKRLTPHVDPLYGDIGQYWLVEAVRLVADWQLVESFVPSVGVVVSGHFHIVIQELQPNGFVETARWREMLEINGQRVDRLNFSRFSPEWLERIGDPMQAELPRSGTGGVRLIAPAQAPEGDPPKQALIFGQRVYLRPEDKKDARISVESSRKEEETFFDIGRHLMSQAGWESFLGSTAGEEFPDKLWFAVCLKDTHEVIGSVGLLDINYVHRTAETGSAFHSVQHRGQGYGSEAKQLLLEYVFNVMGLHMVTSFVYFPNTRSAAALRKQGYREAGRVCWLYPYEGGFGNMVTFDLLADEWRALPRES